MPKSDEILNWLDSLGTISVDLVRNPYVMEWNDYEKANKGYTGFIRFFSCPTQHVSGCKNLREVYEKFHNN